MNYSKIGNFIKNERKSKKLTQAKLAEMLFVSEKTISKWENGNGIPDTSSLPKLCEILGVDLSELLNGEKSSTKNSNQKNEQLLYNITEELESKNKIIWRAMWVIMTVSIIALISGLLIARFLILEGVWQLITIIGFSVVFLIPCFYVLKLEVSVGAYKCKNCGQEITPSYKQALNSMHIGTTRYLKCPNCKKRSWCKKVLNK